MAVSHYVNLTHIMCQHVLLRVQWTVLGNNRGMFNSPEIFSLKIISSQAGGIKKTSISIHSVAENRTACSLAIDLNEYISIIALLWLCSKTAPLQNWITVESSFSVWCLKAARTVYSDRNSSSPVFSYTLNPRFWRWLTLWYYYQSRKHSEIT